jgi:hypothetical protein
VTSYSVEVLGRTGGLRYSEGERTIHIGSETLAPASAIAMSAAAIVRWDPPHDGEPLWDVDRARIISNIQRAFATKGWTLEVTWPFGARQPDGTWRNWT